MMKMSMTNLLKSTMAALVAVCMTACSQPDSLVTASVKASMALDSTVTASKIEVETKNKVVTLTANVDTQAEKDRALEIARSTTGVESVVDMISVKSASGQGEAPEPDRTLGEHIDDATITAAVKTRLLEDPTVEGLEIDVDTREGVVYLTGTVHSQEEGDRAVEVARKTKHVKNVKPNLTIMRG